MIVIYGGSFDPFHLGHANLVEQVLYQIKPQKLYLLPCYQQPLKQQSQTPTEHRIAMMQIAAQHWPQVQLDTREINASTISYTIDSLQAYRKEYPKQSLIFLMGYDSLQTLTKWKDWQQLLDYCHLVVVNRPTIQTSLLQLVPVSWQPSITIELDRLRQQTCGLIYELPAELMDISSSAIRNTIQQSSNQLQQPIADYINKHRLYRTSWKQNV